MLPSQRHKVDLSTLTPQERTVLEKYGRLPARLNGSAANAAMARVRERKFFDSGDYAMSKAGVSSGEAVGTAIPSPADVPHAVSAASEQQPITTGQPDAASHAPAPIQTPGSGPTAGFTGRPAHEAVSAYPVAVPTPSPLASQTQPNQDTVMDEN